MNELVSMLELYLDPNKVWSEQDEQLLNLLLGFAASEILERRYPFGTTLTEPPAQYQNLQVQMAADLYAKLGAQGQLAHAENGISRTWASANISDALLSRIVPIVGVIT